MIQTNCRKGHYKTIAYHATKLVVTLVDVPQGSGLGPFLFNIYLNDLIDIVKRTEICNFVDDKTSFSIWYNSKRVMKNVEYDCITLVEWFSDNYFTLNADKCYLLASGYKNEALFANMGVATIWEENTVKLLDVIIDSGLTFNKHVRDL